MDTRLATLEQLYRRTGPRILRFLMRNLSDAADADELLQETFVVAAREFETLASARSHEAWLIGIARNLLRSYRRRVLFRRMKPLGQEPAAREAGEIDSRLQGMREAIDRLPEGQREVLQLRLVDDLSYAEIAEALDIPIGTVRSRIHSAVAALRSWATAAQSRPRSGQAVHFGESGANTRRPT